MSKGRICRGVISNGFIVRIIIVEFQKADWINYPTTSSLLQIICILFYVLNSFTHTYTHPQVQTCTQTSANMHIHTHTSANMHTHTQVQACTHTYTRTHIQYTYMCIGSCHNKLIFSPMNYTRKLVIHPCSQPFTCLLLECLPDVLFDNFVWSIAHCKQLQ